MFAKIRPAALVVGLMALSAATGAAQAASAIQGRQVPAPPWSFACTTDHGHSNCGEPIWVYVNAR
jgi:hypothetical protein